MNLKKTIEETKAKIADETARLAALKAQQEHDYQEKIRNKVPQARAILQAIIPKEVERRLRSEWENERKLEFSLADLKYRYREYIESTPSLGGPVYNIPDESFYLALLQLSDQVTVTREWHPEDPGSKADGDYGYPAGYSYTIKVKE